MRRLTDAQVAILRVMEAGEIRLEKRPATEKNWWVPSDFQHPLVPVHYQSANQWALPKLKSLAARGMIEKRTDSGTQPDYCYRILERGRHAVRVTIERVIKLPSR